MSVDLDHTLDILGNQNVILDHVKVIVGQTLTGVHRQDLSIISFSTHNYYFFHILQGEAIGIFGIPEVVIKSDISIQEYLLARNIKGEIQNQHNPIVLPCVSVAVTGRFNEGEKDKVLFNVPEMVDKYNPIELYSFSFVVPLDVQSTPLQISSISGEYDHPRVILCEGLYDEDKIYKIPIQI